MLNDVFAQRFSELAAKFSQLPDNANGSYGRFYKGEVWKQWATSAQSLILAVYGKEGPHYQNFIDSYQKCQGGDNDVKELAGLFLACKEDFEGGYVFNVELRVSGGLAFTGSRVSWESE